MDARSWCWFFTSLLLFSISRQPLPQNQIGWQRELTASDTLKRENGPQAALAYLLQLPAPSPYGYRGECQRLWAIAGLEDTLGHWSEADRHLQGCLVHADAEQTAKVQLKRFNVLIKMNRLDQARDTLDSARAYLNGHDYPLLAAIVLHDASKLLEENGKYEEAVELCRESVERFLRLKKRAEAANVRITWAWALYRMGYYDQALEQYLAAQTEALPAEQHLAWGHLGNLVYEKQDFSAATEYYRRAAENARNGDQAYYADWLTNEAGTWVDRGDFTKAAERNALAFQVIRTAPRVAVYEHILLNEARIDAGHGRSGAAIEQLTALVKTVKDPSLTVDAYSELSSIYQTLGDRRAARNAYLSGLQVIGEQRTALLDLNNRLSFETTVIKLTQKYIAGLMELGRPEEALEAAEASRARMLRSGLRLTEETQEQVLHIADYQAAARRSQSAYLAYWVAPQCSYLWIITGSQFRWWALPGEAELLRQVARHQESIQAREDSSGDLDALFQMLIAPAAHSLEGIQNIVIAPDGPLYALNFETLREGPAPSRYWIEDVTVTVAPSLSLMLGKSEPRPEGNGVLLIGDAVEWNRDFQTLLSARQELEQIKAQFPEAATRLTGAAATPGGYEHAEPAKYRYIHFAAHALANRNLPLESAIVLSKAEGRGMLTARDVLATPVHADLVTLSACLSAGARTYAGEGPVGLAWAFLHSGAKAVIAGLWDVNDFSSPILMSALYRGLASKMSAPEALRNAKLELIRGKRYADPYFWGPFLLYRGAGGVSSR